MMNHGITELLIRILGFAVLAFGLLAVFATITGTHPDPFVKWSSVVLAVAITMAGWKLFRRKKDPKPIVQNHAPSATEDTVVHDVPVTLATDEVSFASAAEPLNLSVPPAKEAPPSPVVSAGAFKDLKKQNSAFEDQKHLVGVPHQKPKSRFNILLLDDGIVFTDTKTNSEVYRVQWNLLEAVETDDSRSAKDEAASNSLMTGAIGSGKIGLGGLLAVDLMNDMMSRHPLVIRHRTHPKDPMSSAIVFDTFDNERIATAILAKRSSLLASGKVRFD